MSSHRFADVILPLPVPRTFTYSIPGRLQDNLQPGQRVVVQFGSKKIYAALIRKLHNNDPELVKPKAVLDVLDAEPVVTEDHLQLWEWIAHYYMSTLGEVMNAALPPGLKLDSETIIALHPGWDEGQGDLDNTEFMIVERLKDAETLSVKDIQKIAGKKTVHPIIKSLIEKNIVFASERIVEKYKPKFETYLELAETCEEESGLKAAFDSLKRAPKQEDVLLKFLQMRQDHDIVLKSELSQAMDASAGVLKQLVDKGILIEKQRQVDRLAIDLGDKERRQFQLNPSQQAALQDIHRLHKDHDVALLFGVTSSGKTELYMELMKETVNKGKQVLYLLPEIALTAQIVQRLRNVFGEQVGVYHSKFSANEKVEIWQKVLSREYKIVIGARSALFLPFQDVELIVCDEEHDASYKQFDPAPRYQARDVAVYMAKKFGAKVLLGTATPSLESFHNVHAGKYGMVSLTERFGRVKMPQIMVVNIRAETKKRRMKSLFSWMLLDEMKQALEKEEQVILFQNRRGFAPYMQCVNCSYIPKCERCDVSLSYHKAFNKLKCHYCGYVSEVPATCESCGAQEMRIFGFGTEKVEEEIKIFFPEARVARLDYDATRTKEAHSNIIENFENRRIDILVGTQMVTKGLDFQNVSLVGILNADQILGFPDFRASERGFQLMEQVSGRAGRKDKQGKVIIQTYDPEHPVIQFVLRHNFEGFYNEEYPFRQQFGYPPFARLINITLKHRKSNVVANAARLFCHWLSQGIEGKILGPSIPVIGRIKNYYLQEALIKMNRNLETIERNKQHIREAIRKLGQHQEFKSVRVQVDVDP